MLSPAPNDGRLNFTPASMAQPVLVFAALQVGSNRAHAAAANAVCAVEPLYGDVDVVEDARHLRLAPALRHVQRDHDVGPALAAEGDAAGVGAERWRCRAVICVPPPSPFEPGLSAASVAEKPPPNDAV